VEQSSFPLRVERPRSIKASIARPKLFAAQEFIDSLSTAQGRNLERAKRGNWDYSRAHFAQPRDVRAQKHRSPAFDFKGWNATGRSRRQTTSSVTKRRLRQPGSAPAIEMGTTSALPGARFATTVLRSPVARHEAGFQMAPMKWKTSVAGSALDQNILVGKNDKEQGRLWPKSDTMLGRLTRQGTKYAARRALNRTRCAWKGCRARSEYGTSVIVALSEPRPIKTGFEKHAIGSRMKASGPEFAAT